MGMIHCDVHGCEFIQFCCVHLSDAFDNNTMLSYQIDDGIAMCDGCNQKKAADINVHSE